MWSFFLLILLFSSHPSLSFQSALPNPFSFFRLEALPPQLTDVRFNETMGHSDSLLAIGLNNKDVEPEDVKKDAEVVIEPIDARSYLIPISELAGALEKALEISSKNHEEIKKSGWKVVHQSDIFSLFKRRLKRPGGGDGPVEYLMTGTLPDVSPRTFLHSQIDKECRKQWDKTMKDMSDGSTASMETGGIESEDILYYRTKWPWPLKDRDYTLARRCKLFEDKNAIVLVSKSTECSDRPPAEGVIRVDNYWCHSAILSTRPKEVIPVAQKIPSIDAGAVPARPGKPIEDIVEAPPVWLPPPVVVEVESGAAHNAFGSSQTAPAKFNPRARLEELQRNANFKGGSAFAAKVRSKAREAIVASRSALVAAQRNSKKSAEAEIEQARVEPESLPPIRISNVDLPGMSFITLFCDDQKVPLPSAIVDILSKQGEKVVPESINRLHEIAREVEDKKQQLLGTTVEAAIAPRSPQDSTVAPIVPQGRE